MAGHQHEAVARAGRIRSERRRPRPASGFSTKTCLPASSARARARGASRPASRSRRPRSSGSASTSSKLVVADRRDSAGDRRAPPGRGRRPRDLAPGARAGCGRGSAPSSRARRRPTAHGRRLGVPALHQPASRCGAPTGVRRSRQVEAERPAAHVRDVEVERLANVECARASTCQSPVIPAGRGSARSGAARRARVSYAMHGRGPTSDMSPRRTLTDCGSSSRLVRAAIEPNRRDVLARSSL